MKSRDTVTVSTARNLMTVEWEKRKKTTNAIQSLSSVWYVCTWYQVSYCSHKFARAADAAVIVRVCRVHGVPRKRKYKREKRILIRSHASPSSAGC